MKLALLALAAANLVRTARTRRSQPEEFVYTSPQGVARRSVPPKGPALAYEDVFGPSQPEPAPAQPAQPETPEQATCDLSALGPWPKPYKVTACSMVDAFDPLRLGAKGREVQCLQAVLNAQGYCGYACLRHGNFDRTVRAKVQAFQKIEKLPDTGEVDDRVWCHVLKHADEPARPPAQIKLGATGHDVLRLQYVLTDKGYPTDPSGEFGAETKRQVIKFQRDHSLAQDAIVGPSTWGTLLDMDIENKAPKTLREGAKGAHVKRLQELLADAPRGPFPVAASGTFDAETTRQVKAFQKAWFMKVDGVVGRGTWGKLLHEVLD